MQIENAEEI